jgi:hypothetical protein
MKREQVYKALDTEREYQEKHTANPDRPDMVEEFGLGQGILAMEHLLQTARFLWYSDNPQDNFQGTMEYIRKVAGVAVAMGEKYGLPSR